MIGVTRCAVMFLAVLAMVLVGKHGAVELILKDFKFPSQGKISLKNPPGHKSVFPISLSTSAEKDSSIYNAIFEVSCRMAGFRGPATSMFTGIHQNKFETEIYAYVMKKCSGSETSLYDCKDKPQLEYTRRYRLERINCGYPSDKVTLLGLTNQSSSSNHSLSSKVNILDENPNSCFTTKKEKDPWLEVSLQDSPLFIHTLTLYLTNSSKDLSVEVYEKTSSPTIKCRVTEVKGNEHTVKCDTKFKTNIVKIKLNGENLQLGLCRIDVFAIKDNKGNEIQGTYLDAWNDKPNEKGSIIKFDSRITEHPEKRQFLPLFDIKKIDRRITQETMKQAAFVMVSSGGAYSFGVACKYDCEVWFKRVDEHGLSDPGTQEELLIKYGASPLDDEYDLSSEQSKQVQLSKCHLYHLNLYTHIGGTIDRGFTNMAVKLPGKDDWSFGNDVKKIFFWTRPGSRELQFKISNNIKTQVNLGSNITIEAVYKFCCEGFQCPRCPLSIKMHMLDKIISVNNSVEVNCNLEHKMIYETDVVVQPANYTIQISYSFVGDNSTWEEKRTISSLQVIASVIYRCAFDNTSCFQKWKVIVEPADKNMTRIRRAVVKRDAVKGEVYEVRYTGNSTLVSPLLPWIETYKKIILCLSFSYLLPTKTQSSLSVSIKTSSKQEKLVWSMEGYQGITWDNAKIPIQPQEPFQIVFKSKSLLNNTAVAIRNFEVSTSKCEFRPTYAKPDFQCNKITQFQCKNKRCVDKKYRCNIVKDCIDDSDEDGCFCPIGYFTCLNNKCIKYQQLCDGNPDCSKGEDEERCEKSCSGHQCFDGGCVTGSCSSTVCEDKSHLFSKCKYCKSRDIERCGEQLDSQCQSLQGICGFDNGPCGLTTNSTLPWVIYIPAGKDGYPSYDHSMNENDGSLYLLEPSKNHTISQVTKKWTKSSPYCFQFWYIIPKNSDSSLEIRLDSAKGLVTLWTMRSGVSDEWSFGQVEIPGNSIGQLMITGYSSKRYVALDDISFIEGKCSMIKIQDPPNCYFDGNEKCSWTIDSQWKLESGNLQTGYKQKHQKDSYLRLSQSLSSKKTVGKISSPSIHPKTLGWKCLRFWIFSGEAYLSRKVEVFFVNDSNTSTLVSSYSSIDNRWTYVQLPLPQDKDNLKVAIQGSMDSGAVLALDEITFSKFECQTIPALGGECRLYRNLETPERRDYKTLESGKLTDEMLSPKNWYRIRQGAGNHISQKCVNVTNGCSGKIQAWISGSIPTVQEGPVKRTLYLRFQNICTRKNITITIRNCGDFVVYKLPSYGTTQVDMKYCSSYDHEMEVKKLNITKEWKNWLNNSTDLQWGLLSENQFQDISDKIGVPVEAVANEASGIDLLINGSASFKVYPKGKFKTFTVCIWLSFANTSSVSLAVDIQGAGSVITLTSTSNTWRHLCFTWKSAYGVWQFYVDGVATDDYKTLIHDMKILTNPTMTFSFTSNSPSWLSLTYLNVWDTILEDEQILYMSYKCSSHKGNVVNWEEFLKTNPPGAVIRHNSTCTGKKGNILGLITNTDTTTTKTATYVSPRYSRSSESPGKCLKFRYKLWGHGASALKLYQDDQLEDGLPRRPIWTDDDSKSGAWRDGQVSLSGLSDFKIVIEGETKDGPGMFSIGGLYTTDGYCPTIPSQAQKACNEILTSSTGYVISPYYPGYYSNNANCTWTIKAQPNHVIRLEIQEFELEMSQRCENDYLKLYDGETPSSPIIGRYCGKGYPKIIQSTSNNLLVEFKSNTDIVRSGFMAKYHFIKVEKNDSGCVQDCPADCVCERLSEQAGIVVSSTTLRAVPEHLPKDSIALLFYGSKIFQLELENLNNLKRLEYVDLSFNKILTIEQKSIMNLPSLKVLRLNRNYIKKIEEDIWVETRHLQSIDIGENLISSIARNAFSNFNNLTLLSLRSNSIEELDVDIFQNNTNLTYLYLHDNKISAIPDGLFRNQQKLKILTLHSNKITTFSKSTFKGLKNLNNLTLHNNPIKESTISQDVFDNMGNLKHLSLDSFILCCYASNSIPNLDCKSNANAFSSCDDMLKRTIIRAGIWLQAIIATIGNISVIIWWTLGKDKSKQSGKADVQSFLLINLALADFLMGIYLMIIAIQDIIFKGSYFKHDVDWRSGVTCKMAGGLSTLSSEVSVMMLVAMTADRFNTIIFDFRAKRLNLRFARVLCMFIWAVGFLIAFIPVFLPEYFSDEKTGFTFFGRSTVCLPFQLSSELSAGWEYSVGVFIGFNGVAIFFIFIAYTMIFFKVQRSASQVRNSRTKSSSLGRRVVFVVMTDFCCWMPVIVIGILSLAGSYTDRSGEVYAWIAVFVLPVNSSINPILYTFSTPQVIKKLKSIGKPLSAASGQSDQSTNSTLAAKTHNMSHKPKMSTAPGKINYSVMQEYENPAYENDVTPYHHKMADQNLYDNTKL